MLEHPDYTGFEKINEALERIPAEQQDAVQFELNMFLARLELIEAKSMSDDARSDINFLEIKEGIYSFLRDELVDFLHKILSEERLPQPFPDLKKYHKRMIHTLKELGIFVFYPSGKDFSQTTVPERWLSQMIRLEHIDSDQIMSFLTIYRNRLYSLSDETPYGFASQRQFMRGVIGRDADWNVSFSKVYRGELKLREEIMFALLRRFSTHNRLQYLIAKEMVSKLSESFIESLHSEVENYFRRLVRIQKRRHSNLLAEKEFLHREVDIAAKVQSKSVQRVLPENNDSVQFHVHYQPHLALSGDFYRIHKFNDFEYSLVLCDIAGHGLSAAMYYNTLATSYEKNVKYLDRPDRFMSKLHTELYGKLNDNFVTGICVHIQLKKNRITYCNAGHPKAFLIQRSEEPVRVRFLRPNARILGVFENGRYTTDRIDLHRSQRLVLYTDGFTEQFSSEGKMLGERGLLRFFKDTGQLDQQPAIESVLKEVSQFASDQKAEDDCTMILVDLTPDPTTDKSR